MFALLFVAIPLFSQQKLILKSGTYTVSKGDTVHILLSALKTEYPSVTYGKEVEVFDETYSSLGEPKEEREYGMKMIIHKPCTVPIKKIIIKDGKRTTQVAMTLKFIFPKK